MGKTVYLCFTTDIIHSAHVNIIERASALGDVMIGVLSDEAATGYRHYPLMSYQDRVNIFSHLKHVTKVVEQKTVSYAENIRTYRPDYVVHGDEWIHNYERPVREEVIALLEEYGGELVEFPYDHSKEYTSIEQAVRAQLAIPDRRRGRLRALLDMKPLLTVMEAHSGITGLIVEETKVIKDGEAKQFDAMWVSSLCDSVAKGKPDIEVVDFSSRLRTIDDIMEVTTKPIIMDGDTGGVTEHFIYTVRTLERVGVSAVIIEDKIGLKKNSLFGTDVVQQQDEVAHFCEKIAAGKRAQKTKEFMIIARCESLILEKGMEDALMRTRAYAKAGADGIMIHSRSHSPEEIIAFVKEFRRTDQDTVLVVVPTTYSTIYEEELKKLGVNIVIYANQLTRSGFPAMQKTAQTILSNGRAYEVEESLMPVKEILTLIPEEF